MCEVVALLSSIFSEVSFSRFFVDLCHYFLVLLSFCKKKKKCWITFLIIIVIIIISLSLNYFCGFIFAFFRFLCVFFNQMFVVLW